MHACGHDIHTTVLIGVARAMVAAKSQWHGTLMLIGQPSEETIDGAKAMLADHLYERFGKPDKIHRPARCTNTIAASRQGRAFSPAHGAWPVPHLHRRGHPRHRRPRRLSSAWLRDPVTLRRTLHLTQIQTIVSREQDPQDPAVVTVGDIHGGTKRNIIPDQVKLELTTRAFSDKARQTTITAT